MEQMENQFTDKSQQSQSSLNDEAQLRQFAQQLTEAIKKGDLESIMSFYAAEVVAFDIVPPLQFVGKEAYRKSWQVYTEMMQLPVEQEMSDIHITCSGDLAFCHSLIHTRGKTKDGKDMECQFRNTSCLRKLGGKWQIFHEHLSVPIDMQNDKPLWNLRPGEGSAVH
jgi:ketosteroid isomerase-like protein